MYTMATKQEVENLVKEKVNEVMRNILSNPECDAKLSSDFIKKMKKSIKQKEQGKTKPLADVLKEHISRLNTI